MALDHFAIVSYGVYPTPGKTDDIKSNLWISMGLLNMTLSATIVVIGRLSRWLTIFKRRRR